MPDRTSTLEAALRLVPDGALLGVGGALLKRKPVGFLTALAAAGRQDLRVVSFLASLDAEVLAAHGCLAENESNKLAHDDPSSRLAWPTRNPTAA